MGSSADDIRVLHDCDTSESEDLEDSEYLPISTTCNSDEELQRELDLEEFRLEEVEAELLLKCRGALDWRIETKEGGHEMHLAMGSYYNSYGQWCCRQGASCSTTCGGATCSGKSQTTTTKSEWAWK